MFRIQALRVKNIIKIIINVVLLSSLSLLFDISIVLLL